MEDPGASTSDVLKSINPHALQSGMTSSAAKQVRQRLPPLLLWMHTEDCLTCRISLFCPAV